MRDLQIRHIPADLLDHLVLDTCELESLVERLIRSLESADLEAFPRGPTVVQLLDVLSRMKEASGTLHRTAHDRIRSVASALSADRVVDGKPVRQSRDRVVVGAVDDRGSVA